MAAAATNTTSSQLVVGWAVRIPTHRILDVRFEVSGVHQSGHAVVQKRSYTIRYVDRLPSVVSFDPERWCIVSDIEPSASPAVRYIDDGDDDGFVSMPLGHRYGSVLLDRRNRLVLLSGCDLALHPSVATPTKPYLLAPSSYRIRESLVLPLSDSSSGSLSSNKQSASSRSELHSSHLMPHTNAMVRVA
jgi:hypothetical protein